MDRESLFEKSEDGYLSKGQLLQGAAIIVVGVFVASGLGVLSVKLFHEVKMPTYGGTEEVEVVVVQEVVASFTSFELLEGNYIEVITTPNNILTEAQFVANLPSTASVKLQFLDGPPNTTTLGIKTIPILVSGGGQTQQIDGTLAVRRLEATPVMEGVVPLTVSQGGTVSYRAGVTATDLYGQELEVWVDTSQVNLNRAGVYPITYEATDHLGNQCQASTEIEVIYNKEAVVNETIAGILSQIINNSMTKREKAYAIYQWCHTKITYSSSRSQTELYSIAASSLVSRTGDCYAYQAIAYLMLQQADIDVILMERIDTGKPHKWLAVNVGNGWYHFDACPTRTGAKVFLLSDSEVAGITAATDRLLGYSYHYFTYKTPLPNGVTMR